MLYRVARFAARLGHARAAHLLVVCGLVIGLGMAAAVTWIVVDLRSTHIDHAKQNLNNLAFLLSEELDRGLQGVDLLQLGLIDHLRGLSVSSPELFAQQMQSLVVHQDLAHRIEGLPHVAALSLHDTNGRLVNFSRSWPAPDIDVRERDFIAALLAPNAPKTFISAPTQSLTTGKWTIYFSRRFEAPDGQLIGIVLSTIFADYFEEFFAGIVVDGGRDSTGDGAFSIYRNDGMLLVRYPHADAKIGMRFDGTANYARMLDSLDGGIAWFTSVFDQRVRLVAGRGAPHYPLTITVSDTIDAVLASWRQEARVFGAVTTLLELILATTIVLAVRHLRSFEMLKAAEAARVKAEEHERGAHALQQQGQRFDTALKNMVQGLLMFDQAGQLLVVNRRFCRMFGVPDGAVGAGMSYRALTDAVVAAGQVTAEDMQGVRERRAELVRQNERATATWEIASGRAFNITHRPMEEGWLSTFEEITDRRATEARMAYLAHHDALTDLPNRVLFRQKLEEALAHVRRGDSLALLYLDLDQFKAVNDTLGHPIGDALLRVVAERLAEHARETDTVARLGGDEFAIVQTPIDQPTEATALADRLIGLFDAPFDVEGNQIVIGVSIGIALAPQDCVDGDQLLKCADLALYRAKSDGRGVYRLFHTEMDAQMQLRRLLELDLRQALHAGQFELFFQPVVDLSAGAVTGLEALLRWRHPERGLVSPGDFIPLAEETGLIVPIGEWVLHQACATAMSWPGDQCVAVNLSPAQFKSRCLVPSVAHALSESQLPPDRLELEITETVMLQDTDATLVTLHQLRALGVAIALDDFGTGYSSLSYLRRFPFDRIKIDQSFVRELSSKQDCGAIVRAVTGLSRDLGMATTAEGVETQEQLAQLREAGCTEVQGYLFSRPVPSGDVARVLRSIDEMLQRPVDRPVFEPIE
jgi:diguanylate cyclase (GGDEF)-like protein